MNGYFRDYVLDGEWHSLLPRYFHLSSLVEGKRVLDIGCGSGIGSALLLELGASSVDAIDHRPGVISIAKMKHERENLQFREMFLEALAFEDETFDIVLCLNTESPVTDSNLIEEVRRVLKPTGQYICAIEKSSDKGLDSVLPQYGYINSGEHRNRFDTKNIPQIVNLTDGFSVCHKTHQRPTLSYRFENQNESSTDIVHDLRSDQLDNIEIWFCGNEVNPPQNVEVQLPYFSIVGKIASILSNANQSIGLHDTELPYRRERESTSEFRVVSIEGVASQPPRDDLGLDEDTTVHSDREGFDISNLYNQMKDDFQNVVQQAQTALAERDTYISHLVDTVHNWEQRFKTGADSETSTTVLKAKDAESDNTATTERAALKRPVTEEKPKKKAAKKKTTKKPATKKPAKKASTKKAVTKKATKKTDPK